MYFIFLLVIFSFDRPQWVASTYNFVNFLKKYEISDSDWDILELFSITSSSLTRFVWSLGQTSVYV